MEKLSIVIITYNESANIGRCLDSVNKIADDIVVVDSFSEDDTTKICIEKGARVVEHTFDGHVEQKNYAISCAKYPFILSLDADEALTEKLSEEILKIKAKPEHDGYYFNRLNYYCGRWIKHGGWYPDKKLRLFDSRKGSWKGINPHDKYTMINEASVNYINEDILHYSYYTVSDHIKQIDYFSGIKAREMFKRGKKPGKLKMYFSACFKFISIYFLKAGFLDGHEGYMIARLSSISNLLKYHKLEKMQKEDLIK